MPFYEYQCTDCGERHEALQRHSDDPLVECPSCGEPALERQISAPSFRLKGGGWYETDFKSDKRRNVAGDEPKPAEAKSESNAETKAGTKADKPVEKKVEPAPKPGGEA